LTMTQLELDLWVEERFSDVELANAETYSRLDHFKNVRDCTVYHIPGLGYTIVRYRV